MIAEKVYASDAHHWYDKNGTPVYTVPNKSKPGEYRNTTIRDARVLGLVPSVSEIVRQVHKPALETWKIKNAVRYSVDHPFIGGENFEEYVSWVVQKSAEEAGTVKTTGQEIHGAVEKWLESGVVMGPMEEWVSAADKAIEEIGVKFQAHVEKSFAHPLGFGGRLDMAGDLLSGEKFVTDFKTKNGEFKVPFGWDEHVMQLAAYRKGLAIQQNDPSYESARCFNAFISVEQPGAFYVREWTEEELTRGWGMFHSLLVFWQITKNFYP